MLESMKSVSVSSTTEGRASGDGRLDHVAYLGRSRQVVLTT